MERELRRYQNLLVCVGVGIITFGFWSLIKGVMTMFLYKDDIKEFLLMLGVKQEELSFVIPFINIVLVVIICMDLLLRMIVGTSAKNEGRARDQRRRWVYLVFGLLLGIFSLSSLVSDITRFDENFSGILDGVITVVIDVTSIIMVVEMFVAGVKVKLLKKKISETKTEEVAA